MKVKYLVLILLAIIAISCSKEEEPTENSSALLNLINDCNDPADGSPSLEGMSDWIT